VRSIFKEIAKHDLTDESSKRNAGRAETALSLLPCLTADKEKTRLGHWTEEKWTARKDNIEIDVDTLGETGGQFLTSFLGAKFYP
jgi:hypothetical protein